MFLLHMIINGSKSANMIPSADMKIKAKPSEYKMKKLCTVA